MLRIWTIFSESGCDASNWLVPNPDPDPFPNFSNTKFLHLNVIKVEDHVFLSIHKNVQHKKVKKIYKL
jgi:hypothetical protein